MTALATAPGSVTTVFVPRSGAEGSLGVSLAIEDGVTVSVDPAPEVRIALDGEPTDFEPVSRLLADLGVSASVDIDADIPVGRGFGASGAATLATALAAGERFALDATREELVGASHRAELAAGTGQGDVFVQARGGMVYNTGDGIGRRERTDRLSYTAFEGIETAAVLGDDDALARIATAGRGALESFDPGAPLEEWFETAWSFATETGLVTDRVSEAVTSVESAGGAATMAMVGESVVASGADGTLERETAITPTGARLV
jgi:pantoate kinase